MNNKRHATTTATVAPRVHRWARFAASWWCPHRPIHRIHFADRAQECLRCGEVVERPRLLPPVTVR